MNIVGLSILGMNIVGMNIADMRSILDTSIEARSMYIYSYSYSNIPSKAVISEV